jgi:hypothetical protein
LTRLFFPWKLYTPMRVLFSKKSSCQILLFEILSKGIVLLMLLIWKIIILLICCLVLFLLFYRMQLAEIWCIGWKYQWYAFPWWFFGIISLGISLVQLQIALHLGITLCYVWQENHSPANPRPVLDCPVHGSRWRFSCQVRAWPVPAEILCGLLRVSRTAQPTTPQSTGSNAASEDSLTALDDFAASRYSVATPHV